MIYQIIESPKSYKCLFDGDSKEDVLKQAQDYYEMVVDEDDEFWSGIHEFEHVLVWGDNEEFSEPVTIRVGKDYPESHWYAA